MIKKLCLFVLIISMFNGCTRDDICAEGTAVTPLLIITFKDISNPQLAKTVTGLKIVADYSNNVTILNTTTTDSIAIPLRTGADTTRFRFIKNADAATPNQDIITFLYEREDIYVNRACSFKTIYNNISSEIEDEINFNWILTTNILQSNVENETEAHITIFH
jgi:hypothetical protein